MTPADHADTARVAELLGREPQCDFEVVVRDAHGDPVVIRNAPFLHDGTPMPTRYWLAGRDLLHAHLAFHLAGGDDAVGRWVAALLDGDDAAPTPAPGQAPAAHVAAAGPDVVVLEARRTVLRSGSVEWSMPVGTATLDDLLESDPPRADELTNAIGWFADHLDDALRDHPHLELVDTWQLDGAATLAHVEAGHVVTLPCTLDRPALEEVFRTLVTEHSADRAANPGLPADEVVSVMGVACAVVAFLRRMSCESVTIRS